MLPTRNEVSHYIAQRMEEMRVFSNERFDIQIERKDLDVKHSFNICLRYGQAGFKRIKGQIKSVPFVKLNVGEVVQYPVRAYTEYASLQGKRRVGGFLTQDWRLYLDALMAHEYAHVVQLALPYSMSSLREEGRFMRHGSYRGLGVHESNHGSFFQAVYGILRDQFVNGRVEGLVGLAAKHSQFVRPEGDNPHQEKVNARRAAARTTASPMVGRTVVLGALKVKLIEVNKRAKKYPYIGVTDAGKRYKLSAWQVSSGLQAA